MLLVWPAMVPAVSRPWSISIKVGSPLDKTSTESTGRTSETDAQRPRTAVLTVLLECDRPAAGSELVMLERVKSVSIGRGDARRVSENQLPGGRAVTIAIPDRRISGAHAIIERDGAGFVLRDLGSANGTRVAGAPIDSRKLLHGDVIQVGHTLLSYEEKLIDARVPFSVGPKTTVRTLSSSYAVRLAQLGRIAMTPIPVLLLGESGTGKEVLARVTHELSGRPGAFVAVNCGAIPPNLVESHLFGHQKGSFSGAVRDELGFVRSANGGTLFLDEIGDLPAASQAALLRVLQEGEVHPVGAARPVRVDVRVIAATHRSLDRMQEEGSFRRDLYARLSGFVVQVPPLRERKEDIGQLIGELLVRAESTVRIRPDAASLLVRYDWPLNVRELSQCLSTAAALATDGLIKLEHLPPQVAKQEGPISLLSAVEGLESAPPRSRNTPLSAEDEALRADLIQRLEANAFNISAVAREMGKARQQVQRWVRRFNLRSVDE